MADLNDIRVALIAEIDRYLGPMQQASESTKQAGQQIQQSLQDAGAAAQVGGRQLALFAGATDAAGRPIANAAGQVELFAGDVLQAKGVVIGIPPALDLVGEAAGRATHGATGLTSAIRHMRTEGRMAGFIGRMVSEIGIAAGPAARGIGVVALGLGGMLGPLLALEGGILLIGALREKFEELHKAEEEARTKAREFSVEVVNGAIEGRSTWERFARQLEEQHEPAAVRLAREEMARLDEEAQKATTSMTKAKAELDHLTHESGKVRLQVAEQAYEPGTTPFSRKVAAMPSEELGGLAPADLAPPETPPAVRRDTFEQYLLDRSKLDKDGREAAIAYVKSFTDQAEADAVAANFAIMEALATAPGASESAKKVAQDWMADFQKAAVANAKSQEVARGLEEAKQKEMAAKALEQQRQIHQEQGRYLGDEMRIRQENRDKLAALEQDKAKWGERYDAMRAATIAAGNATLLAAQQKHEDEVRALRLRSETLYASERLKIELRGAEEVKKLEEQQALKKADPAEVSRLQKLIDLQKQITQEELAQYGVQQRLAAAEAMRALQLQAAGVVSTERTKIQSEGAADLTKRQADIDALVARQTALRARGVEDAGLAQQIADQQALLEVARQYQQNRLAIFDVETAITNNARQRTLLDQLEEVNASERRKVEIAGASELRRIQDELTVAKEKYARLPGDPNAPAEIARLERELALQQQINAARIEQVDRELRTTVSEMREVGFSAEAQRGVSAARRTERQEIATARSARDAGLITPAEFDAWTQDIRDRSYRAAVAAKEPWRATFADGVSSSITDAFRAAALEGQTFGDVMKQMLRSLANDVLSVGNSIAKAQLRDLLLGSAPKLEGAELAKVAPRTWVGMNPTAAEEQAGVKPLGAPAVPATELAGSGPLNGTLAVTNEQLRVLNDTLAGLSGNGTSLGDTKDSLGGVKTGLDVQRATTGAASAQEATNTAATAQNTAALLQAARVGGGSSLIGGLPLLGKLFGGGAAAAPTMESFFAADALEAAPLVALAKGGRPPVGVPALGGEEGPELLVHDTGRVSVIGKSGPGLFVAREPGTVIPAAETRRLLVGGGAVALGPQLPRYEDGGRPKVGVVSLGGEKGPELFIPDRAPAEVGSASSRFQMPAAVLGRPGPSYALPNFASVGQPTAHTIPQRDQGAEAIARTIATLRATGAIGDTYHVTIGPNVDAKSFEQMVEDHGDTAIERSVQRLARSGRLGPGGVG